MFKGRLLSALALVLLFIFQPLATHATTPTFDAIYVFGDSYCDVGNIFFLSGQTEPLSPPYYNGRFSNGPIWVEHIASSMGLPMKASQLPPFDGTDYAFGGAEVTAPVPVPGSPLVIPSVPQQVALYLQAHGGKADPKALYIIEGGGNDIINATGGSPDTLGFQIALGLSASELLLRRAGAKNFLIPNLIDVSLLPIAQPNAAFARQASLATNKYLTSLLWAEQLIQGVSIRQINVFSLFQAVVADATHFGFTDIVNPCINPITKTVCADPDHTLFWDLEHPTVFGHSFFAVLTEANLSQ